MDAGDTTPPIVRCTLRMLDAGSLPELAARFVDDLVAQFGARAARILHDGESWAEAGAATDPTGPVARLRMRLSEREDPDAILEVQLLRDDDLPIVRQQLLDLVAVARRAWRQGSLLARERTRAGQDSLTGLENRRGIEDFLEHAFAEAGRGRPLTVMLVDLDHFKRVNDTAGHPAGDDVLQLAAACMREHLRPGDRVCRWGGDEFLVVAPGLPAVAAAAVAERLRAAFERLQRARGTTMTIGIADRSALPPGQGSARALVELADACLYEAKRAGRNRIRRAAGCRRAS